MTKSVTRPLHLAAIAALLLTGCGGGGGGGSAAEIAPQPPPAPRYTISTRIDGEGAGTVEPESLTLDEGRRGEFTLRPDAESDLAAVTGCDGELDGNRYTTAAVAEDCQIRVTFVPAELSPQAQAFRFLSRTTFGPRPEEVDALLKLGDNAYDKWIDQQIAQPASSHLDMLIRIVERDSLVSFDSNQTQPVRVDNWFEVALLGEDQLRQRVAFALSQIMVVSGASPVFQFQFALADYQDLLARHAFGNYRELLEAVTLHPAMGLYLSMLGNRRALPGTNLRPDENYAREAMQLFSVGLVHLNLDGSVRTDANGEPMPTYNQDTIAGFARVFTGWSWACPGGGCELPNVSGANYATPEFNQTQPMKLYPDYHEPGSKQLLDYPGVTLAGGMLPAGLSAEQSLQQALDNIFYHPNVAPFISRQLIQKLVTSNPSPGYVRRVATIFTDDGHGERGNLEAVVRAILLDSEALNPPQEPTSGKLKEPLLRIIQLWRVFDAATTLTSRTDCCPVFELNPLQLFGQSPWLAPSVFNFFSPSYAPPGEIRDAGLVAPELQLSTESLHGHQAWYYFAQAFYSTNRQLGNQGENGMYLNIDEEMTLAGDVEGLLDHLAVKLLGTSRLPAALREGALALMREHGAGNDPDTLQARVSEGIYFITTSPRYAYQP